MKKFFAAGLALFVVLALPVFAQADQSDSVAVKVTILSNLAVEITEGEINLGSVSPGGTKVSTAGVTVTNTGSGINETYSLNLSGAAGWTASQTAAGVETYVLNAAFDADGAGITWNAANHALSTTPVACSATQFAGDQTGVSVSHNAEKKLWFQFQAPTATSVTTEQSITVTVTAQAG